MQRQIFNSTLRAKQMFFLLLLLLLFHCGNDRVVHWHCYASFHGIYVWLHKYDPVSLHIPFVNFLFMSFHYNVTSDYVCAFVVFSSFSSSCQMYKGLFARARALKICDMHCASIIDRASNGTQNFSILNWNKWMNGRLKWRWSNSIATQPTSSSIFHFFQTVSAMVSFCFVLFNQIREKNVG